MMQSRQIGRAAPERDITLPFGRKQKSAHFNVMGIAKMQSFEAALHYTLGRRCLLTGPFHCEATKYLYLKNINVLWRARLYHMVYIVVRL